MKRLIAIFLLIAQLAHAANWYVDNAASGSNNGTSWTNAWTSMTAVVWGGAGVKAGDTLYISGGSTSKTYTEKWTVGASGSAGNLINIRVGQDAGHNGAGGQGVIFDYDAGGDSNTGNAVGLGGNNYLYFDGSYGGVIKMHFKNLRNTTNRSICGAFNTASGAGTFHHNTFRYLDIDNCNNGFDFRYESGNNIVEYCTISVRGDNAAAFLNNTTAAFDQSFFRYNTVTLAFNNNGGSNGPSGYAYAGPDGVQAGKGVTIHNNFFRVNPVAYLTSDQHPDTVQLGADFVSIYNNEFVNVGDSCIDIAYDYTADHTYNDIRIFNNIFRTDTVIDPYPQYIRLYDDSSVGTLDDVSRLQIENNLFVDETQTGGSVISISGFPGSAPTGTGNTIRNNLFINCGVNNSHPVWQIDSSAGAGFNSSWTISNNAYYLPTSTNIYVKWLGTVYQGSTWVTSTGVETGGKIGLPTFVSYTAFASAGNDFHLQASDTVAKNAGATLTLGRPDKDGVAANGAWDIGPYEYFDITPPTLTSATINTAGTQLTLNFNEVVSIGAGGNGGVSLSAALGACTPTFASGSGSTSLLYNLSRTIRQLEAVTVSYAQPGNGIEDGAGNDLVTVSNQAVTNSSTYVPGLTISILNVTNLVYSPPPPPNTPTFVADVGSNLGLSGSSTTTAITLSGAVAQNNRVTVIFTWSGAGQSLGSVTDSRGNTYSIVGTPQTATVGGVAMTVALATAKATTALQVGDTITLNWTGANFGYRFGRVFNTTDVSSTGQPDAVTLTTGTSSSPTAPASTTAAKTSAIGMIIAGNVTYTTGTWTISGTPDFLDGTFRCAYVYKDFTSAGSKDPAGTLSASTTWIAAWVAYK